MPFLFRSRALGCAALTVSLALLAHCGGDDDDSADHDHDSGSDEGAAGGGEHDHDPNLLIGPPSGATCPQGSTLSYDSFGKMFMDTYCTRCHSSQLKGAARMGATPDHDFDIFEGIIGVAMHVDEKAAAGPDSINTAMPPPASTGPKPTLEERMLLGEWLACELDKIQ